MSFKPTHYGYVRGTAQNVSDAIREREQTNREGIAADREVKKAEWQIELEKATGERQAKLEAIKSELCVNLANIGADLSVNLKKTTAGLNSEQNFKIQSQGLDNKALEIEAVKLMKMQQIAGNHEENMKKLDIQQSVIEGQFGERSMLINSRHELTLSAMNNDHEQTKLAIQAKAKITMEALKKGGKS